MKPKQYSLVTVGLHAFITSLIFAIFANASVEANVVMPEGIFRFLLFLAVYYVIDFVLMYAMVRGLFNLCYKQWHRNLVKMLGAILLMFIGMLTLGIAHWIDFSTRAAEVTYIFIFLTFYSALLYAPICAFIKLAPYQEEIHDIQLMSIGQHLS
ncbi:hypothetical protein LX64_03575 [Chitinophaga skermanii]|uniref:Uncharacterized protein n=1 Tax=Chitinophaga skermanii TaxID=331697 RepID=A0A327QEX6_9BACT|nr:hypothetical protein [Chitinophaga skermanii]RAJ02555.1 hypothetical protein LX64_03575 [Chitinophaga skermanii]